MSFHNTNYKKVIHLYTPYYYTCGKSNIQEYEEFQQKVLINNPYKGKHTLYTSARRESMMTLMVQ
jgi:hypothetical protein